MSDTVGAGLNMIWEKRVMDLGADFVHCVDISSLPEDMTGGFGCAVLFGKALSKEYISDIIEGRPPRTKEVINTERKMDSIAVRLADQLEGEGFESVGKIKTGVLPHKTVALRAGLGFIGKNNLLVTPEYGCDLMLGKALTKAPFLASCVEPMGVRCGDCDACVKACPNGALLDTTWSVTTTRDEILTRKKCTLCLRCMVGCPYTQRYAQ